MVSVGVGGAVGVVVVIVVGVVGVYVFGVCCRCCWCWRRLLIPVFVVARKAYWWRFLFLGLLSVFMAVMLTVLLEVLLAVLLLVLSVFVVFRGSFLVTKPMYCCCRICCCEEDVLVAVPVELKIFPEVWLTGLQASEERCWTW